MKLQSLKNILGLLIFTTLGVSPANAADYQNKSGKDISYIRIDYPTDSNTLSDADRTRLRDLVTTARSKDRMYPVSIVAWSDHALPQTGIKLSAADRDLARNRAEGVKAFLSDELKVSRIETYNMAEDANWFARTFGTTDADLKSVFGKKGAQAPVTNSEYLVVKNEGGASKAIVMITSMKK